MDHSRPILSKDIPGQAARASWDSYWRNIETPDYVNHTPHIIEVICDNIDLEGCQVLEVGAGTGGNASTLAKLGAVVTAVDFVEPALERTAKTARNLGVNLNVVQCDAFHLPFTEGAFELVFHQCFLEHFAQPAILLREQRRVLRTGGYLLVDVPQRYNWYTIHKRRLMSAVRWPYGGWEREFSLRELSALLESEEFEIVVAYGRGYYPSPLRMIRNLERIERTLPGQRLLPTNVWRRYDSWWHQFEKTAVGCYTLQCIGVLARAR